MKQKLWITAFLLILVLVLSSFSSQGVYARETYNVGTSSLNVRTEPSLDAQVIGSLPNGATVNVLEIKYDWAKVQYNGQTGWIASYFLTQQSAAGGTEISDSAVTVAANGVRLRSGPGTEHSIIGYTTYGNRFQLIDRVNDWLQVRTHNGETAWIADWLVSSATASTTSTVPIQKKSPPAAAHKNGTLAGRTVVLDAGHGGYDPGAIGIGGIFEKDLTMRTAQIVATKLKQAGAEVIMTRAGDRHLNLQERVHISRSFPSSVFLSIHYNAHANPGAKGMATFYYHNSDKELSLAIQNQLAQQTSLQNAGAQHGDFYVLRNNDPLSVLIELGFITNPYDMAEIQSLNYQHQVAESITQGLIDYFN
ncbi:N-acetylmuramoyl-L-alanine amidase [Lederbergia citrea]|uniref:N-acetylmuramoyl-L-alanine amidase n=1 Tax=Lederbergia citrea TaxID=2833581 RepID=UPI001BC99D24|nr:N-acetylmuramoyl-L-alanine amidase [Lederbergia citrea]MBS4177927.1 N-acetylmuramoyl-L-alanine amidase [Lederbergia citrea]